MVNVAFSVMKKENVVKNHDGKAAPYGSGYEKIDEVGVFPVQNYFKGILPSKSLDIMNDRDRERVKSLIKDLVFTLNDFWKSHKIPFRVREPRKSDLNNLKRKIKDFNMKLEVIRYSSQKDSTLGMLFDVTKGRKFLCFTLEDEARRTKVKGETRIKRWYLQTKIEKRRWLSRKIC